VSKVSFQHAHDPAVVNLNGLQGCGRARRGRVAIRRPSAPSVARARCPPRGPCHAFVAGELPRHALVPSSPLYGIALARRS